eukprot:TRINITY_DN5280_c0_g2_i1.p1 TRINITY_DN5280_c0_g2~~TRINITY_DN5280_c0_g2_i1.p1  ORF type:complete len:806 (+),score=200.72 TRINITY_DN5280_c0_g2_i1:286-2703(+)
MEPTVSSENSTSAADITDKTEDVILNLGGQETASLAESEFQLDQFLLTALANPRDRLTILKLDHELEKFMKDPRRNRADFPPMSSYHRLIVHRVAQYFKLDHIVVDLEGGKRAVALLKSPESRTPVLRFADLVEQQVEGNETANKNVKIMRRSAEGPQTGGFGGDYKSKRSNSASGGSAKDRSIEEREQEYARARARIFGHDLPPDGSQPSPEENTVASESSSPESTPTMGARVAHEIRPESLRGEANPVLTTPNLSSTPKMQPQKTASGRGGPVLKSKQSLPDSSDYNRNLPTLDSPFNQPIHAAAWSPVWNAGGVSPTMSAMSSNFEPSPYYNYEAYRLADGSFYPRSGFPQSGPPVSWNEGGHSAPFITFAQSSYIPIAAISQVQSHPQGALNSQNANAHNSPTISSTTATNLQHQIPTNQPTSTAESQKSFNNQPQTRPTAKPPIKVAKPSQKVDSPRLLSNSGGGFTPSAQPLSQNLRAPIGPNSPYSQMAFAEDQPQLGIAWPQFYAANPSIQAPYIAYAPFYTASQQEINAAAVHNMMSPHAISHSHSYGNFSMPYAAQVNNYERRPPRSAELFDPNAPNEKPKGRSNQTASAILANDLRHLNLNFPRSPSHESFFTGPPQPQRSRVASGPSTPMLVPGHPAYPPQSTLSGEAKPVITPQQFDHILEVVNVANGGEQLLNDVRQCGATIKNLDSSTVIAIFKSSQVAKRVLATQNPDNLGVSPDNTTTPHLRPWRASIVTAAAPQTNITPNVTSEAASEGSSQTSSKEAAVNSERTVDSSPFAPPAERLRMGEQSNDQ